MRTSREQLAAWRNLEQARVREQQRKTVRHEVHIAAQIDRGTGEPLLDCLVTDISEVGAGISVGACEPLPTTFLLLLCPSGKPSRLCRLVWRKGSRIGVECGKTD